MCTQVSPWAANPRGKVWQMIATTQWGNSFESIDPAKGLYRLKGNGNATWVWHNRSGWSNATGASLTLSGIPGGTTNIEVYRYNSWSQSAGGKGARSPYRSVATSATTYTFTNLPQNETLMFIAKGSFRIKNRWTGDYLRDAGANAGYGTGSDDTYRWTWVDVEGCWRQLKNKSTGHLLNIEGKTGVVQCDRTSAGWSSQWRLESPTGFQRAIQNRWVPDAYMNVEQRSGSIQYGGTGYGSWSRHWELVP